MNKLLFILIGAALLCGVNACNTVRGVGEDVSVVGQDVSAGARSVQHAVRN